MDTNKQPTVGGVIPIIGAKWSLLFFWVVQVFVLPGEGGHKTFETTMWVFFVAARRNVPRGMWGNRSMVRNTKNAWEMTKITTTKKWQKYGWNVLLWSDEIPAWWGTMPAKVVYIDYLSLNAIKIHARGCFSRSFLEERTWSVLCCIQKLLMGCFYNVKVYRP